MKTILLIFISLYLSGSVFSQENERQKEIGIAFYSLSSFGLEYRTGNPKALWRFNTAFINGGSQFINQINDKMRIDSDFSVNAGIGREFRSGNSGDLGFKYGFDLGFGYWNSTFRTKDKVDKDENEFNRRISFGPQFNLMLGINYTINNKIIIGAEILPNVSLSKSLKKKGNNQDVEIFDKTWVLDYGLSNSGIKLTVAVKL